MSPESIKAKVRFDFREIKKRAGKLRNLSGDDYYKQQENLKEFMRVFLREHDFTTLPKAEFLTLCSLVSSHRPVEPHNFLTRISMQLDEEI